jgi:hypothetical protein
MTHRDLNPDELPESQRTGNEPAPAADREPDNPTPGRRQSSSRQQTVRGQKTQTGSPELDRESAQDDDPEPLPPSPERR